jgi:hypothetical protein
MKPGTLNEEWNLGIVLSTLVQGSIGWEIPTWAEVIDIYNMIVVSPEVIFELGINGQVEFHLWFVELIVRLNLNVYKFTPFDFLSKIDAANPERNCYGMTYYAEGLYTSIEVESKVDECHVGFLAYTWDGFDPYDCWWRHYELQLPIWSIQIGEWLDFFGHYFRY